jgi:hypothetical protein
LLFYKHHVATGEPRVAVPSVPGCVRLLQGCCWPGELGLCGRHQFLPHNTAPAPPCTMHHALCTGSADRTACAAVVEAARVLDDTSCYLGHEYMARVDVWRQIICTQQAPHHQCLPMLTNAKRARIVSAGTAWRCGTACTASVRRATSEQVHARCRWEWCAGSAATPMPSCAEPCTLAMGVRQWSWAPATAPGSVQETGGGRQPHRAPWSPTQSGCARRRAGQAAAAAGSAPVHPNPPLLPAGTRRQHC